jgi:AbrB family looped-hinge helix DNA binding protein
MKIASNTVTLSSKYQVVVPAAMRESLHLKPGAKLTWVEVNGVAQLIPYKPASDYRGIARALANSDIPSDPERF